VACTGRPAASVCAQGFWWGWRIGDKTGGGGNAQTNDIAVIWPPGRGRLAVRI